jgi:uncharacterized protein
VITDSVFYIFAVPAILLMGVSKGGFGSGLGILATPLMALTVPTPQAAAILLPILCAMDLFGLLAYRGKWSRENIRLILVGGLAGVVLGALSFRFFSEAMIRGLLGLIAVTFVADAWLKRNRGTSATKPSTTKGLFWSTLSGLTSTIAHAGGPPLNVYLLPQRLERTALVGTTVIFFAVINAAKVVPYLWLGLFDAQNLSTSLVLLPLAPLGIWLGVWMLRRVDQELFYRICYSLLLIVGIKLLFDGLRGLL